MIVYDVIVTSSHDEPVPCVCTQDLRSKYSKYRRTRGDGNCFFRAFAFSYMESVLKDKADLPRWGSAFVVENPLRLF